MVAVLAAFAAVQESARAEIAAQAKAMEPLMQTELARDWLKAADRLPAVRPRTIYRDTATGTWGRQPGEGLEPFEVTEDFYYLTKYGTPVAYARAIDLAGRYAIRTWANRRILDFGYGGIGQLKMMAWNGAEVFGVDVDPMLKALYGWPNDTGEFGSGQVRTVHGRWPGEQVPRESIGSFLHLFLAKNTLKKGYIHPAEPIDSKRRVDLGVNDEAFIRLLFNALRPDGVAIIYNLCPPKAKPGEPYIPAADGKNPFPQQQWEEAGFEVVEFDADDSAFARKMARALGWDKGSDAMDPDKDLFAWYSVLRKPR
jgi:SAM-dependent methyltransferase